MCPRQGSATQGTRRRSRTAWNLETLAPSYIDHIKAAIEGTFENMRLPGTSMTRSRCPAGMCPHVSVSRGHTRILRFGVAYLGAGFVTEREQERISCVVCVALPHAPLFSLAHPPTHQTCADQGRGCCCSATARRNLHARTQTASEWVSE